VEVEKRRRSFAERDFPRPQPQQPNLNVTRRRTSSPALHTTLLSNILPSSAPYWSSPLQSPPRPLHSPSPPTHSHHLPYRPVTMPALNFNLQPAKRAENSGRNFSIIFAVVAFAIVSGCLFYGVFLPKYRKKHPRRPSSTRYNGSHQHQSFPSHPALLRGFRHESSRRLRKYNPRTQTPFPNTPPPGDCVSLPSLNSWNRSTPNIGFVNSSDGIFSPARDRLPSRRGMPVDPTLHSTTIDIGRHQHDPDDDCILPVPEPLVLRPKSAGRAPTLAQQLDRFPLPRSESADTGKLAHPKKLFGDLEQRYSKSTTITSLGTPSPMPLNTQRQNELAKSCPTEHHDLAGPLNSLPILPSSWRSLQRIQTKSVNNGKEGHLKRAGTATRPKTPVAATKDMCDDKVGIAGTKGAESSKSTMISSIDNATDLTSSSYFRSVTPPTSPPEHLKMKAPATTLLGEHHSNITPTPSRTHGEDSPGYMAFRAFGSSAAMDAIPEGKKPGSRIGQLFRPNRSLLRPRPARLELTCNSKSSSVKDKGQRHSMSSLGSLLMPLASLKRPSVQASSVYSRDTRGISIVRSPTTPTFSDKASADVEEKASVLGPIARKASSLDLLRHKIDNWDLRTTFLGFPTSPSSALKRVLSDLGPSSPTFPGERSVSMETARNAVHRTVPRIYVGRPSDDIFRDPSPKVESGTVLKRVLDMEVAASMANLTRTRSKGSAPGGADWL
jgi:hypothetical protein